MDDIQKIISVDPSSTKTGYAVFTRQSDQRWACIDAGLLTPYRTKDKAWIRIVTMAAGLHQLIKEYQPDHAVIEVSGGKVHGRIKSASHGAGLAVYGEAVGAMTMVIHQQLTDRTYSRVPANDWTRGRRKQNRQAVLSAARSRYDATQDKGGDCADAIDLGRWWLRERLGVVADA